MGKVPNVIFAVLGTAFALCADAPLPGDARKGLEVFREQRCVTCHSVNGQGGKSAPDLGRKIGRSYTPDEMAGLMWNHAPAMWSAMEKAGVPRPQLTSEQASDLFAYFFAARYFEKPGDAARGRQVFVSKHCAECHNLTGAPSGGAPPVTAWQSLGDPILLAEGMWNHSANMSAAMERKRVSWPHMTGQEMTDLLVYLQNLPQMKGVQPQFSPASAETGKTLFEVKGCAGCHKDISKFAAAPGNPRSLGDFAAGMWNHAPAMRGVKSMPSLNGEEMRRIVGYLWSVQFFEPKGNPTAGKRVFEQKHCASCHVSGPGPKIAAGSAEPFEMVSALWLHGPNMLSEMRKKRVEWPRFREPEMANLLAYLNSTK